jgi:hypothetical protein
MKAALARLGIRGFNPKLKKAVDRLDGLRTSEGEAIPPNTLAELKHDMERRARPQSNPGHRGDPPGAPRASPR